MKKILISFFIISFSLKADDTCNDTCIKAECDSNAQRTFLRPRSTIEDVPLFLGMQNYRIYQKYLNIPIITDKIIDRYENYFAHGAIFFNNSRKGNEIKKYFFPDGITTSTDQLENQIQNYVACPNRQTIGLALDYHQDFQCYEDLWFEIKFAMYRAKHNFLINCENGDCCDSTSFLDSLTEEKISLCEQKKFGVDDIEVKLGYTAYHCIDRGAYLSPYGSLLIPTASKPKGEILFEPLVGRNHWALGVGINSGLKIFEDHKAQRYIALMGDLSYQYLFQGCEPRLVRAATNCVAQNSLLLNELNNLEQTINSNLTSVPLPITNQINSIKNNVLNNELKKLFTKDLKVTPGSVINLWVAMHYQHASWNIEFGYNLWWKDNEKLCKFKQCENEPQNLDFEAALNPSAFTNKIYLLMGYFATEALHTIPFYFAGSYEFARDKNALENWEIWLGAEFSF